MENRRQGPQGERDMEARISQFLGEFRILVPGLAALLGFQLTSAYSNGWQDLPYSSKVLNYAAVLCTMLALIFILVPALYHRSMREIEESDRFLRFAGRHFGYGVTSFGLGLVITVYLQGLRVFEDEVASLAGAAVIALVLVVLWIGIPNRRVKRILAEAPEGSGGRQHALPIVPPKREQKGAAGRQL